MKMEMVMVMMTMRLLMHGHDTATLSMLGLIDDDVNNT